MHNLLTMGISVNYGKGREKRKRMTLTSTGTRLGQKLQTVITFIHYTIRIESIEQAHQAIISLSYETRLPLTFRAATAL